MTFKPTTYLVSFSLFVMLFMALGGYVGYGKLADHFLAQDYLEALPIQVQVQRDRQGPVVRWEDRVLLARGVSARILASDRALPISIEYSEAPGSTLQPPARVVAISLAPLERTEDIRVGKAGRYLYARVLAAASVEAKPITWLYKYDLEQRRLVRRTAANPILLPAPFKP